MEKTEYKIKLDQIETLVRSGDKQEAVDLLDTLNYRKIRNVNVLLRASEVYEEAGEAEKARDILEMAHERSPIGRMIIYRLALLSVRMGELNEANEYYEEFVEIAPHDSLKYIIRYNIAKANGSDAKGLIAILEELKQHDFIEKWAFELACLYRSTAQVDKCIDLCDEIVLWFGEGPYVEKALEMKMLYTPLNQAQEDKYRRFQRRKDGVTEIRPEDSGADEILSHPVTIPKVEAKPERFNTVNLQAEIKKNIEEIMQATETGEVSENMDAIKDLIGDIPYLSAGKPEEEEEVQEEAEPVPTIQDSFQQYLAEEYDGQMSINLPTRTREEQIQGQMTIQDVMEDWERTRRAAEAALEEARARKLEEAKAKALKEAEQIMDRLVEAAPQLDAGVSPEELLRQEYLSRGEDENRAVEILAQAHQKEDPVAEKMKTEDQEHSRIATDGDERTFEIPKVHAHVDGQEDVADEVGLKIPVLPAADALKKAVRQAGVAVTHMDEEKDLKAWEPPRLSAEEVAEQKKIKEDKIAEKPEEKAEEKVEESTEAVAEEKATKPEDIMADVNKMLQEQIDELTIEAEEEAKEEKVASEDAGELKVSSRQTTRVLPSGTDIIKAIRETPVAAALSDTQVMNLSGAIEDVMQDELPQAKLTDDEADILSYFTSVDGMEKQICRALSGIRTRLADPEHVNFGNLTVSGSNGTGKTALSSKLIRILQKETGKLKGSAGRISGEKLNGKDLQALLTKVAGGSLMVEGAGEINRETAVSLALLIENDTAGTLFILEDSKIGLDRLKSRSPQLFRLFTEHISIPVMTIDELVTFGKAYVLDLGYSMDDMAILGLYDRIGILQRGEEPISLHEIKAIIDRGIQKLERRSKGIFGHFTAKLTDEDGRPILQEKDILE
ncbi:hypothetical protein SAMN02910400_01793 [Lachnospiraceae bacterium C10]|nr:hypothetical protein SAMN02910400_01793 [Lachnospiraceae bacterium C10]